MSKETSAPAANRATVRNQANSSNKVTPEQLHATAAQLKAFHDGLIPLVAPVLNQRFGQRRLALRYGGLIIGMDKHPSAAELIYNLGNPGAEPKRTVAFARGLSAIFENRSTVWSAVAAQMNHQKDDLNLGSDYPMIVMDPRVSSIAEMDRVIGSAVKSAKSVTVSLLMTKAEFDHFRAANHSVTQGLSALISGKNVTVLYLDEADAGTLAKQMAGGSGVVSLTESLMHLLQKPEARQVTAVSVVSSPLLQYQVDSNQLRALLGSTLANQIVINILYLIPVVNFEGDVEGSVEAYVIGKIQA